MENVLWNCGKWENLDVGQTWSAMASSTFSLSQEGRHDVQSACPVRIWNLLPPSNSHHSSEVKKKLLVAGRMENPRKSLAIMVLIVSPLLQTDLWGTRGCTNPGIGNSHQPPGWLIFGTERCGKILGNIWDLAKWSICTCSLIPANPTSNSHKSEDNFHKPKSV
jgi:hypothetical protein